MPNSKSNDIVQLDFETCSQIDLKAHGTVRYATDKSTFVLCAYIIWNDIRHMFNPATNRKETRKLIEAIYESGATLEAYNWTFEYYIIRYVCTRLYDWPVFPIERFNCAMATTLRHGLPGNLAADSEYCKTAPKDNEGHRLMLRLTKPYRPGAVQKREKPDGWIFWDNDPDKHRAVQRYCIQDVEAEKELMEKVPPLSKKEMKIFRIDQRMSTVGVHIDTRLCTGAIEIFDQYKKALLKRIPKKVWNHFDTINQREKVMMYVRSLDDTIVLPNMQQETVDMVLRTCTNSTARKILTAYREAGGQAVNKYRKALDMQYDGKLYCNLQYCGAAGTGRWAGRGVQLHNMNRPTISYDERCIELIQAGDFRQLEKHAESLINYDGNVPTVSEILKSNMRSFIVPLKGTYLAVNDYKAIEARLVFWCSDCKPGLKLFASGGDPYVTQAAMIYDIKEKKVNPHPQRFVGKQNILGCGYGMGAPRFRDQCGEFNVNIGMGLASKAVNTYRSRYSEVVDYWKQLTDTIIFLLDRNIKDKWAQCKRVDFMYDGKNILMRLPSGTILYYHKMRIVNDQLVYYTTPTTGARKMVKRTTWGGTILQNICEAVARELMADAMIRLDALDFPNLLTVHDELINSIGHKDCMPEVQACILTKNKWARDIPLDIEGEVLDRYRKI